MKKFFLPLLIFLGSSLIALYNISGFPKMVGDEGIYVAQGWWLAHFHALGPYTYWYDHFPLGWIQIGLWQLIVGPLRFYGSSVLSARVFMGLVLAGTTTILYLLTHQLTKSKLSGFLASALFITSTLTLTFGRMVLLDNLAIFWFLLSLLLLFTHPSSLKYLVISGITLAMGILSKESLLFFLPPYLFIVYYLNRESHHREYALFINYLTAFFLLGFFPLLALLKGELIPQTNQVSFLGTLLFQAKRGAGLAFWLPGSDFRQMLSVWLSIDPIFIYLGSVSTLLALVIKLPFVQKIIPVFALFFLLFLVRGGQIYDFYLIPLLPLLAINTALLIYHFSLLTKIRLLPLILLLSSLVYFFTSSLYPFTSQATNSQTTSIEALKKLPASAEVIANNYAYLDIKLGTNQSINWYSKVESDPPVQAAYRASSQPKYLLVDETIAREAKAGSLTFLSGELANAKVITTFGRSLSPGESATTKPYTSEFLTLYQKATPAQTIVNLIPLSDLGTTRPDGVVITRHDFASSTDLQNLLTSLKSKFGSTFKIIVIQDDTSSNTIPWVTYPARTFYKSIGEAETATLTKTNALASLGFTGAVISSTDDSDGYLSTIIQAVPSDFTPILRFTGTVPSFPANLLVTNQSDLNTLKSANYSGQIFYFVNPGN